MNAINSSAKNGAFFLQKTPAILLLENGKRFLGFQFGASGETVGEICFNTGMSGYQEILTDPSYCGQLVSMTYPHIGNYGINKKDIESNNIQVSGFIIKEETIVPSNYRSISSLGQYLRENNIVGIQGVDTRAITRIVREEGVMNAIISSVNLDDKILTKKLSQAPSMFGLDLVPEVTCKKAYFWDKPPINKYKIVAIDFGIKHNILRMLQSLNCEILVLPATSTVEEIKEFNPDGIFLSNGPGDPAAVYYAIQTVKGLLGKYPIFGICLGHQLLAIALGAKTYKLKFGHRGCNHPVKNIKTGKVEITSQNHGFCVEENSLPPYAKVTHININDNTVAGIFCPKFNAYSVQYHPEASPGPNDSRYLFDDFIEFMDQARAQKN